MKDYYAILGLSRSASEKEIKQAYRELAKKFHPDRNDDSPEANERFKEVSEAYSVLGSPEDRAEYDFHTSPGRHSHHSSFEDLFSNLGWNPFGGQGGFPPPHMNSRNAPPVGKISIDLTVEELRSGGKEFPIKIRVKKTCETCGGAGGKDVRICHFCRGSGQQQKLHNSGGMVIQMSVPCSLCHGRGKLFSGICKPCMGDGKIRVVEEYGIKIEVTRKG